MYGYGLQPVKRRNPISKLLSGNAEAAPPKPRINISVMEDFRRVSAIIDVDIVPETHRRVRLMKNGSEKPLGFYIRDGTSVRVTPQGLEKVMESLLITALPFVLLMETVFILSNIAKELSLPDKKSRVKKGFLCFYSVEIHSIITGEYTLERRMLN